MVSLTVAEWYMPLLFSDLDIFSSWASGSAWNVKLIVIMMRSKMAATLNIVSDTMIYGADFELMIILDDVYAIITHSALISIID